MFGSFGDEEVDEHQLAHICRVDSGSARRAACWYFIRKLQAYVYSAEYGRAAAMAARAQPSLWTATADFVEAEYQFYAALARAAVADSASDEERQELLANAARHHQRLLNGRQLP